MQSRIFVKSLWVIYTYVSRGGCVPVTECVSINMVGVINEMKARISGEDKSWSPPRGRDLC